MIAICDEAVALAPADTSARNARGLAHVLLGNTDAAVADLELYVKGAERIPWEQDAVEQRKAWIAALRAGREIKAEVLEALP